MEKMQRKCRLERKIYKERDNGRDREGREGEGKIGEGREGTFMKDIKCKEFRG